MTATEALSRETILAAVQIRLAAADAAWRAGGDAGRREAGLAACAESLALLEKWPSAEAPGARSRLEAAVGSTNDQP